MKKLISPIAFALCSILLTLSTAQAQYNPADVLPAAAATGAAAPAAATAPTVSKDAKASPGGVVVDADYLKQNNGERAKVQPGNNAPMWRAVGQGADGQSSLPKREAPEAGNLIQGQVQYPGSRLTNAGDAWRQTRNNVIIPYGGALIFIALLAVGLFYWRKGSIGLHGEETGKTIVRFSAFERAAHWSNAIAFCILVISGLVMAFGKFFLQPIIGNALFGWLTYLLKNAHNFAGPLFAVSLFVVFCVFVRDNLPSKADMAWLRKGGGLFSGEHVPSHRFNAGEKIVFWGGVFFLGVIVVGSGLVLDKLIPNIEYLRATMQVSHMIHAVAALLMMAMFIGHIYLGTVGMKGAYKAMKTGKVDETWAKEHHEIWYDDVKSGKIAAKKE